MRAQIHNVAQATAAETLRENNFPQLNSVRSVLLMLKRKCRWLRMALMVPLMVALPLQSAWSLGLAEIEVDSALNEKFSAAIDLMDLGDLSEDEILVSMASREDFDRVGVERFFYLTDLKFELDLKGRAKVVISSSRVISEPYLNFIVEIMWPKGRLLKEFTVLLDPPTFTETAAAPINAPAPIASRQRGQNSTPSARTADQVSLRSPARANRMVANAEGEVMSTTDDTLWKIADRTRGSEASVNQQMLAIQALNPRAFIRDNINLLKAGYRLKVPSEAQALALSQGEAFAEVRQQTNSWRNPDQESLAQAPATSDEGSALRSQVDGTPIQSESNNSTQSAQGQVRIVANSGELSQGTVADGGEADAQLIEEKATLSRQVEELNYQLDREKELAESQVALKERQLEVKDQALAQLQERVAQLEQAQENDGQQQNQTATSPVVEVPWWQSPLFLGGVIGVLVLLLAWAMVGARRRDDEEVQDYGHVDYDENDTDYDTDYEDEVTVEPVVGSVEEDSLEGDEVVDETKDEFNELLESEHDLDEPDLEKDQQPAFDGAESGGDVVAEADIYMAYGRYGQAVSLLLDTLSKKPERHDVRLKLLEVCVEAEDPAQFSEHAEYLVENCDDEDILLAVRDLEGRLSDQVSDLNELQGDENEDTSNASEGGGDELLTLDELDDAPDAIDTEDAAAESEAEDGLDFELEFDGDDNQNVKDAKDDTDDHDDQISEDLGGDLGIDFDPDSSEGESDSDSGLDFELDLDSEETESTEDQGDFDLDTLELDEDTDAAEGARSDSTDDAPESPSNTSSEDSEGFNDFDFETDSDSDVNATKLDLAEAYIDMGDGEGARDILREVLEEGSAEQISKAQSLIDSLA
ncbi:MAG: pilus assembly protein FimV [Limisphaerales bacterium]